MDKGCKQMRARPGLGRESWLLACSPLVLRSGRVGERLRRATSDAAWGPWLVGRTASADFRRLLCHCGRCDAMAAAAERAYWRIGCSPW